jgi:nitrite reductase/ring-hydroxylating ferredoxin subunit
MEQPYRFVKATSLRLLRERPIRSFKIGLFKSVTIFHVGSEVYATQGHCVHMHAPLLTGQLEGRKITCSWHGWQYDVTTGECFTHNWARLTTYPVKIEGEDVFVGLPEDVNVEPMREDWETG